MSAVDLNIALMDRFCPMAAHALLLAFQTCFRTGDIILAARIAQMSGTLPRAS